MNQDQTPDRREEGHAPHPVSGPRHSWNREIEPVEKIRLRGVLTARFPSDDDAPAVQAALRFRRRVMPVMLVLAAAALFFIWKNFPAVEHEAPTATTAATR